MNLVHNDFHFHPQAVERFGIYDLSHRSQPWYAVYMTALFEADRHAAVEKLRCAEKLMIERERQIHNEGTSFAERNALDKAFQAQALRLCLKLHN